MLLARAKPAEYSDRHMDSVLPALVLGVCLIITVVVAIRLLRGTQAGRGSDDALSLLQNRMASSMAQTGRQIEALQAALSSSMQAVNSQLAQSLSEANKTMGERLDNTGKVIGDVRQQLGELKESTKRMIQVGEDVAKLEDVLKPPKLRGGLGEDIDLAA